MSSNLIWLLGGVLFNVLAAVALKFNAAQGSNFGIDLKFIVVTHWIILALTSYLAAFVFYAKSLENMSLSIAQPIFTIGSLLGVVVLASLFFEERLDFAQKTGFLLMISGLVLMVISAIHNRV